MSLHYFFKKILVLFLFVFIGCKNNYQGNIKKSNKYIKIAQAYEEVGQYTNALEYYQQAYYLTERIQYAEKASDLFIKSHQYKEGLLWLNGQFRKTRVPQALYSIYARLLIYNEEYSSAKRYLVKSNFDSLTKQFWLQSCDSAIHWEKYPQTYRIRNLQKINSSYSDISPVFFQDNKLVFTSSREGIIIRKKVGERNQPYYNLYSASQQGNTWTKPMKFSNILNTFHHEGAVTFSKDFQDIYITRGGTKNYKDQEIHYLKLYKSSYNNITWSKPSYFVLNDSTASFGHPYLGLNDKAFLFASDLPNGYGGTDLYICFKEEDGWTSPINLGPNINTKEDELYPFLTDKGILFFSSNGHIGMGGFDIYKSKLINGEWTLAKNLEKPINTSFDDFSFIINDSTKIGYFSSNRLGGKGAEDLYEIEVTSSLFR